MILLVALGSSGDLAGGITSLPMWASRALALAALPAGFAVSRDILPDHLFAWREPVAMFFLSASLVFGSFLLANYVGPVMQSAPNAVVDERDTGHMLFGQFRSHVRNAVQGAEAGSDPGTVDHWFVANALVWQYDSRVTASVLPMLFGWIGILAGFWIRMTPRADLRQLQYWGIGLFLVMSTYLAGENSFELIVVRAAGPVFFSGLFVLFVPVMLIGGLGWPAALLIWRRRSEAPAN
jgi:hypothetical protein